MSTYISQHFTLEEFTATSYPELQSMPNNHALIQMVYLCDRLLEPLREELGKPLYINSGYRSPALNQKVGGALSSQHLYGQAADLTTRNRADINRIKQIILDKQLPFDQLIIYQNFVHLSHTTKSTNRRQIIYK